MDKYLTHYEYITKQDVYNSMKQKNDVEDFENNRLNYDKPFFKRSTLHMYH